MLEFLRRLFSSDFMPHGTCYLWNPAVLWLNVISDSLIALAYYTIPVLLFVFARKRKDLAFHWIFVAFGVFILACGTTHAMGVWTVWHATYRLDGMIKAGTAIASLVTAAMLVPVLPGLVRLPSPTQLAKMNLALEEEIRERAQANKMLERQAGLLDLAHDAIVVRRSDGTILFWNRGAETMYGWSNAEVRGRILHELLHTRFPEPMDQIMQRLAVAGRWEGELIHTTRNNDTVIVSSRWASSVGETGALEILEIHTDITQQKAAEERLRSLNHELEQRVIDRTAELRESNEQLKAEMARRETLEEQLLHSQKMEAIGRLAGGVAHDFNNLLTIIIGHCRLLLERLESGGSLFERLTQILEAADRAAGLTSQLLAFSRKQIVQPKVVNLNTVVENSERMLRRVIGEDIRLVTALSPGLAPTKVDPGQIGQVLMNLVINARDAMPQGGQIIIETANVKLDANYANSHLELATGDYVMLAVSDSGQGMDAGLQSRIFEPFFTTKEQSKGTGLGLATVYGIIKQCGGDISVSSEPGRGTTFRIYVPRSVEACEVSEAADSATAGSPAGTETILLVEDDKGVRDLAREILAQHGYTVLETESGSDALEFCAKYHGPIDLLLTDVVMPGLTGRDVGERIRASHPRVKILYMTGYTDDTVIQHGIVDTGSLVLRKPFTPDALILRVQELLKTEKPFSILVVDDEEKVREMVREMLERAGYQVWVAARQEDVLAEFQNRSIDMMITDSVMPEGEGVATVWHLRRRFPKLKIVSMSGDPGRGASQGTSNSGADVSLQKPIQAAELLDTVRRLLG